MSDAMARALRCARLSSSMRAAIARACHGGGGVAKWCDLRILRILHGRRDTTFGRRDTTFGRAPTTFGRAPTTFGRAPTTFGRAPTTFGRGVATRPSGGAAVDNTTRPSGRPRDLRAGRRHTTFGRARVVGRARVGGPARARDTTFGRARGRAAHGLRAGLWRAHDLRAGGPWGVSSAPAVDSESLSSLLAATVAFAIGTSVVLRDRKRPQAVGLAVFCFTLGLYHVARFFHGFSGAELFAWFGQTIALLLPWTADRLLASFVPTS